MKINLIFYSVFTFLVLIYFEHELTCVKIIVTIVNKYIYSFLYF